MNTLEIDAELEIGTFRLSIKEQIQLDGVAAIFGPSGSGKTTLLRIIAGLESRARGRVALDGNVWQDEGKWVKPHMRRVGFVFQDGHLFNHLSVESNLRFPIRFSQSERMLDYSAVVNALDLEPLLQRRPATLSGGERQRVAIGRALIASPRLLLMDEPVSSLDKERRRDIVHMIAELPSRFGLPVIYVTHDIAELTRLANHTLVLADGRVAAAGPLAAVVHAATVSGESNRSDEGCVLETVVRSHSDRLTTLGISVEVDVGIGVGAGLSEGAGINAGADANANGASLRIPRVDISIGRSIRIHIAARDVVIATESPTGLSIRNVLAGSIESIDYRDGILCDVHLRMQTQKLLARITCDAAEDLKLAPGQNVFALIKSVAIDDSLWI
jgi:molybdate transport system ATP-binding protein